MASAQESEPAEQSAELVLHFEKRIRILRSGHWSRKMLQFFREKRLVHISRWESEMKNSVFASACAKTSAWLRNAEHIKIQKDFVIIYLDCTVSVLCMIVITRSNGSTVIKGPLGLEIFKLL